MAPLAPDTLSDAPGRGKFRPIVRTQRPRYLPRRLCHPPPAGVMRQSKISRDAGDSRDKRKNILIYSMYPCKKLRKKLIRLAGLGWFWTFQPGLHHKHPICVLLGVNEPVSDDLLAVGIRH